MCVPLFDVIRNENVPPGMPFLATVFGWRWVTQFAHWCAIQIIDITIIDHRWTNATLIRWIFPATSFDFCMPCGWTASFFFFWCWCEQRLTRRSDHDDRRWWWQLFHVIAIVCIIVSKITKFRCTIAIIIVWTILLFWVTFFTGHRCLIWRIFILLAQTHTMVLNRLGFINTHFRYRKTNEWKQE